MSIQMMLLGTGAVATKTYVDDIFSTFLYKGTGGANTVNTGLDISGEGGLVWVKNRTYARNSMLFDTVRGVNQEIATQSTSAQNNNTGLNQTFTSTGFTFNTSNSDVNSSSYDYASWSFRKSPMFDVVTYTGNGTAGRTISHNLGCVPGMIMVKQTSGTEDWTVYHRETGAGNKLILNTNGAAGATSSWNSTTPTATSFTVGSIAATNSNSQTYVAYVFAGGESTAATARSVDFDGSGDYLSLASTTDLNLTGDFTIEFWVYPRNQASGTRQSVIQTSSAWGSQYAVVQVSHPSYVGKAMIWDYDMNSSAPIITSNKQIPEDQWTHVAFTRSSGTIKIWINGTLDKTATGLSDSIEFGHATSYIANHDNSYYLNAKLSNFRIVKGTAVYTSSFRPPTEPLTNITNTKLLCCNNSSTTGKTVGPTITANGDPTASTDSPFDDPAGFKFGDAGDQNVIKCGSYVGNGSSTGPEINLGWEPSWVMIKISSGANYGWTMLDTMRGIPTGENNARLRANESGAEDTAMGELINVNPTGFQLKDSTDSVNASGNTYIYMAIRRPDGYVGKPPELGTGVFAMTTGQGGSSAPNYAGGIVVDYHLTRDVDSVNSWYTGSRLIGTKYLQTNATDAEAVSSTWVYDYMDGYNTGSSGSDWQSWQWKRHAGFDVVTYKANGVAGRQIAHSLSKAPEMIWLKQRSTNNNSWVVGHKGLNSGTDPWDYALKLNGTDAEANAINKFNDTAPTSTHFTVGDSSWVNGTNNYDQIAMLFASVDGISKVGSFSNSGSGDLAITGLGFSPRFVLVKATNQAWDWYVWDTTRGFVAGNDPYLLLNTTAAQYTGQDFADPSTDGFTLTTNFFGTYTGVQGIYYAHA